MRPRAYYLGAYTPHDQAETAAAGCAGDPDRHEADPRGDGDPLAALLDQILADLDAGQVARPRDDRGDPPPPLGMPPPTEIDRRGEMGYNRPRCTDWQDLGDQAHAGATTARQEQPL